MTPGDKRGGGPAVWENGGGNCGSRLPFLRPHSPHSAFRSSPRRWWVVGAVFSRCPVLGSNPWQLLDTSVLIRTGLFRPTKVKLFEGRSRGAGSRNVSSQSAGFSLLAHRWSLFNVFPPEGRQGKGEGKKKSTF